MFLDKLKEKAKALQKRIVLPEGTDPRPVQAAEILMKDKLMKEVIILGEKGKVNEIAKENGVNLDIEGISILDPKQMEERDEYISMLHESRKHKGVDMDKAKQMYEGSTLFAGAAMTAADKVDGMVAGCINATADVIRSALFLIGLEEGNKTLSSFFLMIHPDSSFFTDGVFLYADCGVVPNPTASQLADITVSTAASYKQLVGDGVKAALLSFSTYASASDPIVDKVVEAKKILDERKPSFQYDGELQFDAAMLPKVAAKKCPDSPLKGEANTFIFPDLNAGNICYKATQRLAGCTALGPVLQGTKKPVNDLSRGCSAQDIADVAVITALQSDK